MITTIITIIIIIIIISSHMNLHTLNNKPTVCK